MHTTPIVEATNTRGSQRTFIAYCLERPTLLFSIKMALVVGTLLAVINHGQAMFTGHFTSDRLLPMLLTYCVPFAVAMYSQIQGKRQRDRFQAEISAAVMQTVMKPTDDEQSGRMQISTILSPVPPQCLTCSLNARMSSGPICLKSLSALLNARAGNRVKWNTNGFCVVHLGNSSQQEGASCYACNYL